MLAAGRRCRGASTPPGRPPQECRLHRPGAGIGSRRTRAKVRAVPRKRRRDRSRCRCADLLRRDPGRALRRDRRTSRPGRRDDSARGRIRASFQRSARSSGIRNTSARSRPPQAPGAVILLKGADTVDRQPRRPRDRQHQCAAEPRHRRLGRCSGGPHHRPAGARPERLRSGLRRDVASRRGARHSAGCGPHRRRLCRSRVASVLWNRPHSLASPKSLCYRARPLQRARTLGARAW